MKNVAHCLFSYYFTFERPYLQAVFVLRACLLLNLSSPLLYLFIYLFINVRSYALGMSNFCAHLMHRTYSTRLGPTCVPACVYTRSL